MKSKTSIIIAVFALLTLFGACWQAREAATLDSRLRAIDAHSQIQRLTELSTERIQNAASTLLANERNKIGKAPDLSRLDYPMPKGGRSEYAKGYFLLTPDSLRVPAGETAFEKELTENPTLIDTIRRKASNPAAPVLNPNEADKVDTATQAGVFAVYEVTETDPAAPLQAKGEPSPFFAWNHLGDVVYMRSIPTTHGPAAEGVVMDAAELAKILLPLAEPGLKDAAISYPQRGEASNLAPLPLVLRPGESVDIPDTEERSAAVQGTVVSAWFTTLLTIAILFGILAFYARMERRRSDFVSAVTHELRTPLTSFQMMTEMLRNGQVAADKVPEYHENLHRESKRLAHLVENVLSFARLTRGKVRGRQDAGPCRQLLANAFEKHAERLKNAGFKVHINQDSRTDLLSLRTDLLSLDQILTNLTDNTIKYAAAVDAPAVNISTVRTHRDIAIRFADNGPGMQEEIRKRLFKPFSRSAQADRNRKPGIGLGLALSRDIARSIGGDLSLEKSTPQGTTFVLTLPLGE